MLLKGRDDISADTLSRSSVKTNLVVESVEYIQGKMLLFGLERLTS